MNPLESAHAELQLLLGKKAELDAKISAVQQSIKILEPVYNREFSGAMAAKIADDLEQDWSNLGMTSAVERVLMFQPNAWLPPVAVRDELVARGFDIRGENPMASIHTVLKRLVDKDGPIVSGTDSNHGIVYSYQPSIPWKAPRGRRTVTGTVK